LFSDQDRQTKGVESDASNKTDTLVDRSIIFKYKVLSANIADSADKQFLELSYTILCKKEPIVNVSTNMPGISLIPHSYDNFYKPKFYESTVAFSCYIILFFMIYIYAVVKISSYVHSHKEEKLTKYIKKQFSEEIDRNNVKLDAAEIMKLYKIFKERYEFEKSSAFKRWLYQIKDPDIDQ
jgi:hypothetical protein